MSGTGKAMRRKQGLRHGMINKPAAASARSGSSVLVADVDQPRVLRMLGPR